MHVLLIERVQAEALADRAAELSVATAERWEDYEPIRVADRLAAFEEWLNADPTDSPDARVDAQVRKLMGVA